MWPGLLRGIVYCEFPRFPIRWVWRMERSPAGLAGTAYLGSVCAARALRREEVCGGLGGEARPCRGQENARHERCRNVLP